MKRLLLLASTCLVLFVGLVAAPLTASPAFADAKSDICNGVGGTGGGTCAGSGPSIGSIVGSVINILSMVIGVISVIMVIIGGFMYVTSNGDSGKIANAKNTIIYALVGIVVVAFAQAIVFFVLHGVGL